MPQNAFNTVVPVHDDVDAAVEDPSEGVVAARGPGQHHPTVNGGNEVVDYLDQR